VSFTRVVRRGNSIQFTAMEGTILGVDGCGAVVRVRNGRRYTASLKSLRPLGQQSAVGEMFTAIAEAVSKAP